MTEEDYAARLYPKMRHWAGRVARWTREIIPADDLAQIGMIALLEQARKSGEPDDRVASVIARRRMLDAIREQTSRGRTGTCQIGANEDGEEIDIPDQRAPGESDLISAIDTRLYLAMVESGRQRRVLARWIAGERLIDIGRDEGVKESAAFHLKKRAIAAIRRLAA